MDQEGITDLLDQSEIRALCMHFSGDAALNSDVENLVIKNQYFINRQNQNEVHSPSEMPNILGAEPQVDFDSLQGAEQINTSDEISGSHQDISESVDSILTNSALNKEDVKNDAKQKIDTNQAALLDPKIL